MSNVDYDGIFNFYRDVLEQVANLSNSTEGEFKNVEFEDKHIYQICQNSQDNIIRFYERLISLIKPRVKVKVNIDQSEKINKYKISIQIRLDLIRIFRSHTVLPIKFINKFLTEFYENNAIATPVLNEIKNFNIKWDEKLTDFLNSSSQEKIHFLSKNILQFLTPSEFEHIVNQLDLKLSNSTGIQCLSPIVNPIDFQDNVSILSIQQKVQHLFFLQPIAKELFHKTVHRSIKNIIIDNKGKFKFPIDSFRELKRVITVFRGFGILVVPSKIVKAIENDHSLSKYLLKDKNSMIWDQYKIARIIDILGPYIQNSEISVHKMKKKSRKSSILPKLNLEMNQRRRRKSGYLEELIKIENSKSSLSGKKHRRNSKLALLMKEYFDYTCEACSRRESKDVMIEVSHKVPLYFGYKMGGVDKSWNMEVLCHECHMKYEKDFDHMLFKNSGIKSKNELREYLKQRFPENFDLLQ